MFSRVAEAPTVLALVGEKNVRLYLAIASLYIHLFGDVLAFESDLDKVCWISTAAAWVDGIASYGNNIIFICNEFMEVFRTVRPADIVNRACTCRYEHSASTSI